MQIKELSCPNCGTSLTQHNPTSQTIICSACGSHVAIGVGEPTKLSDAGKLKRPPKPIRLGDRVTLQSVQYVVLGRVEYEGWDSEEKWQWTEWLLGANDGRFFWMSYDDEVGFAIYYKMRIYQPFSLTDRTVPVGKSGFARIKERYPARIVGAEGELTWQARAGEKLNVIEGAGMGRLYSIQATAEEIELYEGVTLNEDDVARAFGNKKWMRQAKARQNRQFVMAFAGGMSLIVALIGLLLGVIFGQTGNKILSETVTLNSTNQEVTYPVEFSSDRPARITLDMQNNLPVDSWAEVDVSVFSPDDNEEVDVFSNEFWYETGSDEDGPWSETDYSGTGRFIPAHKGTHQVKVVLGETDTGVGNVTVKVEVYENHFLPFWMYGLGGLSGVMGLGFLAASAPKRAGQFISAILEDD